jgi:hypothetical protein|tara:strand:- start:663 stop:803 length:141 start_codon:yes stop_codon:yes gene_type:complete
MILMIFAYGNALTVLAAIIFLQYLNNTLKYKSRQFYIYAKRKERKC